MQLNNRLSIILDEIAAEGLEGITFECLWNYLSIYGHFKNLDDKYKEYLWKFIRKFTKINFYKLNEPRECNFKMQNRFSQYNFEGEFFVEDVIPMTQIFKYKTVQDNNVYGSCCTYDSRTLIDDEIKSNANLTYSDIMTNYGNCLVMVASQEYRWEFLGIKKAKEFFGKPTYALLEFIGRSRHSGIKSTGANSALEFIKDSQVLWYLKKTLMSEDLIRIQKLNFLQRNKTTKEVVVFHINRYYRPLYNIFETNLDKLLTFTNNIFSSGVLKTFFLETLELSEEFLKRAKQLGWVEIIVTTYRILNQSCDLDDYYTDKQFLQFYIEDFWLPPNKIHPLSLIDKRSCFIKPVKTLMELKEKIDRQAALFETDEEPTPDIIFSNSFKGMNIDEPLYIQVLKLLAQQPLSAKEIKIAFGLSKFDVRGLLNSLTRNNQVVVNFKAIDRHSVPFYTIRQTLVPPVPLYDDSIKQLAGSDDNRENSILKFENPSQLTPEMRNPKRKERYDYLVGLVKSKRVVAGFHSIQKLIRDWELSRNMKETMDRKSCKRIIDDAVKCRMVKVIDVDLPTPLKTITEKWLILPGITRKHDIFQEEYAKRLDELSSREKNIKINSPKIKSKKKPRTTVAHSSSCINILKETRDIRWDSQIMDFKFPELPLMMRRKLFHEFIWYISVGSHAEPNINIKPKRDQYGFRIYMDTFDWKRYVAPLQQDPEDKFITFNLNDVLSRMPLCLLCLLALPKECNEELYDCILDENIRLATLENLATSHISVVAFILNSYKKLALRKIINLMESLLNMGLITKRDLVPPSRFKEDASFYLNREVFITDTTKYKLPLADQLIWKRLPRYQWVLKSPLDVINYWENVYNVCTNTRCELAYRVHGLQIISDYCQENVRNSDFIAKHVLGNGRVSADDAENILQLGAWLPSIDNIKWKHLGPGGFYLSLSSWSIVAWCQDRFDKMCSHIPYAVRKSFNEFRTTLFNETIKNLKSYVHISSLNESLSMVLNEINIVITAAAILRYEEKFEKFWNNIRSKKWFKNSFTHIRNYSMHTFLRYKDQLSIEHVNEREYLKNEAMNIPAIESHSKILLIAEFRERNANKESVAIRSLLLKLIKLHRFIPQWESMNTNQYTLNNNVQDTDDNVSKMIDVLNINTSYEFNRKTIYPDKTDTVSDIAMLSIMKYLTGCMNTFKEHSPVDIEKRNKVLRCFSKDMLLAVINGFKNYYVLEPLKANKSNTDLITSGVLDNRLAKLAVRLTHRSSNEIPQYLFSRRYLEWIGHPEIHNRVGSNTRSHDSVRDNYEFRFSPDTSDSKTLMSLISLLYAMDSRVDSFVLGMDTNNFYFNDIKYDAKSVCQSSLYSINMKHKNLALLDWHKLTKNTSLTVKLSEITYNQMFKCDSNLNRDIWSHFSELLQIPSSVPHKPKRIRTRSQTNVQDDVLEYIEEGQYGGKNYKELKKKFPDVESHLRDLERLLHEKKIYLVGMNTFHFVHHDYIRPWVIKASSAPSEVTANENPLKRSSSAIDDTHSTCFVPEFYRSESGDFKCITFSEIINRIYNNAFKNPGCTLHSLMSDLSIYIGEVVVREMIHVLAKYQVVKLQSVKKTGKCGLFQKRPSYKCIEYNPYGDPVNTTVIPHPLSHLYMSNLLSDMGQYFNVDIIDHMMTSLKKE